jgi:hypothetical protein
MFRFGKLNSLSSTVSPSPFFLGPSEMSHLPRLKRSKIKRRWALPVNGQTSYCQQVRFRNLSAVARDPIRVALTVAGPRLSLSNNETSVVDVAIE